MTDIDPMEDRRLDDVAVVRRLKSETTHVTHVGAAWRAHLIVDYWAPVINAYAACGVQIPTMAAIMQTGTKVTCRACAHITGVTEQSPAVHEKLKGLLP